MSKSPDSPIGFFDSGVGGLSIWQEVNRLLPFEATHYLADSKNAPYGEKSKSEIIQFSIKNTELLLSYGCKMIVVACNTATTNAIDHLRSNFDVPFIGIEPATKPAAISTKTGKIGILATKGTLASELFLNTSKQFRSDVEIIETVGTSLVQMIESGNLDATEPLLKSYIVPMLESGVDNIVLGCTHYPFLKPILHRFVPSNVNIIDSGEAVARQTKHILTTNALNTAKTELPKHVFETNAQIDILNAFIHRVGAQNFSSRQLNF